MIHPGRVLTSTIAIPRLIRLREKQGGHQALDWSWNGDSIAPESFDLKEVDLRALPDFLDLTDADPEMILRFAEAYGPLHLCKCGLPAPQTPGFTGNLRTLGLEGCGRWVEGGDDAFACQPLCSEAISEWRAWATRFRERWDIGEWLLMGEFLADEENVRLIGRLFEEANRGWRGSTPAMLSEGHRSDGPFPRSDGVGDEDEPGFVDVETEDGLDPSEMARILAHGRSILQRELNSLLAIAGIRPRVDWATDTPRVVLESPGIFGVLVQQLIAHVQGGLDYTECASCGTVFEPGARRRPREKRHWCGRPECKRAQNKAAARRYRRRKGGSQKRKM